MPQLLNKLIGFTYNELIQGGVMSKFDYKNYLNANKIERLNRGCRGTEPVVRYDNMHPSIKEKVHKVFGSNIAAIAKQNPLKQWLQKDVQAEEFFATHTYETTKKHITPEKQAIYCANAAAYNAIGAFINDRKTYRKTRGANGIGKTTWPDIIEALKAYQPEWGFKLPMSERNLRQNLIEYKEQGYISLISKKDGNDNALATKETEQQATLRQLLRNPNNLNNEQVLFMYNEIAQRLDWRKISVATIANRRQEWNLTTISGRRGEQHFNNNIAMQHKRSNPGYPLKFWSVDGWLVELNYQQQHINAKGHSITTYDNRLNTVMVMDAFKNYIIGYAIGTHETPELIKKAMLNALQHTQELFGCMYRPNQLQTDNYSIKSLTPLYEAISPRFTPTEIKNAKAKPIENKFDKFNTRHLQYHHNWSGHNVTASPANQPNEEYKNKIRHSFPTEDACRQQIINAIEADRALNKELYIAKFAELPQEYKLPWNTEQFLYNAGYSTGYTNKLQGNGITLTLNKIPYVYDCFDTDFRNHTHIDWVLKYNPTNMQHVLAHSTDGTIRFLLEQKHIQPMALVDRQDGDAEQLQKTKNYNKELKSGILEVIQDDYDAVYDMFNQHPQLNDTLAKMRLVDSMGQHKDRLSEQRINTQATKVLAKQERKQVAAAAKQQQNTYTEFIDSKVKDVLNDYL